MCESINHFSQLLMLGVERESERCEVQLEKDLELFLENCTKPQNLVTQSVVSWSLKPCIQIDVSMKHKSRKKVELFDDLQLESTLTIARFSNALLNCFQSSMIFCIRRSLIENSWFYFLFSSSTIHFLFVVFAQHICALDNCGSLNQWSDTIAGCVLSHLSSISLPRCI